jgi:hypothetical protein
VDNWKNITNSQNSFRKKSFVGTFCFSNCHIIGLDTEGLVFLVSGSDTGSLVLIVFGGILLSLWVPKALLVSRFSQPAAFLETQGLPNVSQFIFCYSYKSYFSKDARFLRGVVNCTELRCVIILISFRVTHPNCSVYN